MKSLITLISLFALKSVCIAQVNYSVTSIPKSLFPYASAIIRNKETSIEVKSPESTVYHIKKAITILNKSGDEHARVVVWHNKANVIKSIKGLIYDEFGAVAGKFNESNFTDVNAGNDFSLFEDSRIKHHLPVAVSYPYTVEYEYEVRSKQTLNFPDWKPSEETGVAIEKSSFKFSCKSDFNIRYKELNLKSGPVIITTDKNLKTYSWTVNNIAAIKDEPYSPNPATYESCVKIAPEHFTYENLTGSFSNWYELGRWIYENLLVNRDQLPPSTIAKIKELTKDVVSPKEKARRIYEYMQQKTRYISIQIGIGGYQPFLASEVDRLGYGDCKALVNYTQSLLKAAEIESYYCVVDGGDDRTNMIADFASMDQGNHIILCLPFKNDTTWLECTNQKIPFGFLGDFTDNRTVLACTQRGGILLRTPKYTSVNNVQYRKAAFKITEAGYLDGSMTTTFKGLQYDNRKGLLEEASTEQIKSLKHIYPINNMDIERFRFEQSNGILPEITENIKLLARDYAAASDGKLNFIINPVNRTSQVPRELRTRLKPVFINTGYVDDDIIEYILPDNFKVEKQPLNVSIKKPFGTFAASMVLKDNTITYKRHIELLDGSYDKDSYQELVDFFKVVTDADSYSVALIKN